jgi:hypothetical protein
MSSARAVEIISQVKALLEELNRLTSDIPLPDRVKHDIFERYFFGCSGGPGGVVKEIIPTVAKIPVWPDRQQHNTYEFSRIGARNRGTPERMIWELYPAQNAIEREEALRRIREAESKERSKASPDELMLKRAAALAAKRENKPAECFLADAAWVAQQRELQRLIQGIKIVY